LTRLVQKAHKFHETHFEKHLNCKETTQKVDHTMAFIGIMGPLFTLSQVAHIFITKNVGGISIYTWVGYMAVSSCWVVYGFFYRDRPIVIVNTMSVFINSFIIFGFALYH